MNRGIVKRRKEVSGLVFVCVCVCVFVGHSRDNVRINSSGGRGVIDCVVFLCGGG